MAKQSKSEIVHRLMKRHGQTYCAELGIDIESNTPSPLFCWLVGSLLFSARIGAAQAVEASRALFDAGWKTPEKMAKATWEERVRVLNRNGYARYDESTSRMLADTSEYLLEHYHGDLRNLRREADGDVERAAGLLTGFKGIGKTGASIFLREVQTAWDEFYPFVDDRALKAARDIGLGKDVKALSDLVPKKDLPVLLTALVRADLAGDVEAIGKGEPVEA